MFELGLTQSALSDSYPSGFPSQVDLGDMSTDALLSLLSNATEQQHGMIMQEYVNRTGAPDQLTYPCRHHSGAG